MRLSALVALQLAANAFAFCPQARGQPRVLSPSPLALPRVLSAPQANGIKITSVNSAAARAAARREANELQNPAPPPVPQPPVLQPPPVPQVQEATGSVAQGVMGIEPVMGLPQAPVSQVTLTVTLTKP